MDPERWRELDGLLAEAMEREQDERAEWLVRRCDGDAELLQEARTLLELEERSREFLETPALIRDPERIADYASCGGWRRAAPRSCTRPCATATSSRWR